MLFYNNVAELRQILGGSAPKFINTGFRRPGSFGSSLGFYLAIHLVEKVRSLGDGAVQIRLA
jgi:hypothetical protein